MSVTNVPGRVLRRRRGQRKCNEFDIFGQINNYNYNNNNTHSNNIFDVSGTWKKSKITGLSAVSTFGKGIIGHSNSTVVASLYFS